MELVLALLAGGAWEVLELVLFVPADDTEGVAVVDDPEAAVWGVGAAGGIATGRIIRTGVDDPDEGGGVGAVAGIKAAGAMTAGMEAAAGTEAVGRTRLLLMSWRVEERAEITPNSTPQSGFRNVASRCLISQSVKYLRPLSSWRFLLCWIRPFLLR